MLGLGKVCPMRAYWTMAGFSGLYHFQKLCPTLWAMPDMNKSFICYNGMAVSSSVDMHLTYDTKRILWTCNRCCQIQDGPGSSLQVEQLISHQISLWMPFGNKPFCCSPHFTSLHSYFLSPGAFSPWSLQNEASFEFNPYSGN